MLLGPGLRTRVRCQGVQDTPQEGKGWKIVTFQVVAGADENASAQSSDHIYNLRLEQGQQYEPVYMRATIQRNGASGRPPATLPVSARLDTRKTPGAAPVYRYEGQVGTLNLEGRIAGGVDEFTYSNQRSGSTVCTLGYRQGVYPSITTMGTHGSDIETMEGLVTLPEISEGDNPKVKGRGRLKANPNGDTLLAENDYFRAAGVSFVDLSLSIAGSGSHQRVAIKDQATILYFAGHGTSYMGDISNPVTLSNQASSLCSLVPWHVDYTAAWTEEDVDVDPLGPVGGHFHPFSAVMNNMPIQSVVGACDYWGDGLDCVVLACCSVLNIPSITNSDSLANRYSKPWGDVWASYTIRGCIQAHGPVALLGYYGEAPGDKEAGGAGDVKYDTTQHGKLSDADYAAAWMDSTSRQYAAAITATRYWYQYRYLSASIGGKQSGLWTIRTEAHRPSVGN